MARPHKIPSGKWRIRWTDENGSRCSAVFSSKSDADYHLKKKQLNTEQIKRGLKQAKSRKLSFEQLCDYWISHRTVHKRSPKDDISIISKHLLPFFSKIKLDDICQGAIDQYYLDKYDLSPKTVHNHITLLISMLNVAVQMNALLKTPSLRKPKLRDNVEYKYLRSKYEISIFIKAAYDFDSMLHDLYLTAILTGMRKGELCGLKWADIDLDRRIITVQRSFDKPTKSGRLRYIPILDQLKDLLQHKKISSNSIYVFTDLLGNPLKAGDRAFKKYFHRVVDACEFQTIKTNGKNQRYIVFHSLRHTFASHWAMAGGDIFKLKKILGHSSIELTMRYAHLSPHAFAEDYKRLVGIIDTKIFDKQSSILKLFS